MRRATSERHLCSDRRTGARRGATRRRRHRDAEWTRRAADARRRRRQRHQVSARLSPLWHVGANTASSPSTAEHQATCRSLNLFANKASLSRWTNNANCFFFFIFSDTPQITSCWRSEEKPGRGRCGGLPPSPRFLSICRPDAPPPHPSPAISSPGCVPSQITRKRLCICSSLDLSSRRVGNSLDKEHCMRSCFLCHVLV